MMPIRPCALLGAILLLGACEQVHRVPPVQGGRELAAAQARLVPTVRALPEADLDLLWKASEGFMIRAFRESSLDLRDSLARVIETHTLEYGDERLPRRTRVTVEVRRNSQRPSEAELGVIALDIAADIGAFATGIEELPQQWFLAGQLPDVEQLVADQIVRRYLLLRQGRDPETVPLGEPFPGLRSRGG
jgi:hypothetical protein